MEEREEEEEEMIGRREKKEVIHLSSPEPRAKTYPPTLPLPYMLRKNCVAPRLRSRLELARKVTHVS